MIVVADTTLLIGLAAIGQYSLLRQLFGQVIIAEAVYQPMEARWLI
jgi:predicted nucleic acid-binding protein